MRLLSLLLATTVIVGADYAPRLDTGMLLEPHGTVLHGVGQSDLIEHASLGIRLQVGGAWPAFHMVYCGVKGTPKGVDRRLQRWAKEFAAVPADVGINLGLSFTTDGKGRESEYADAVIAGEHDAALVQLFTGLAKFQRPVWVRIGYECNGHWNGYQAETYKAAFRHITTLMREHGSNRLASVWCVHPIHDLKTIMTFHPGDEWVDWWAIDLFQPKFMNRPVVRQYCKAAADHGRPVMIGEASPAQVTGTASERWRTWFEPFFTLIREEPSIKAFSYINRNWNTSRWRWGDCRVEVDPQLLQRYDAEMALPLYQHAQLPLPAPLHLDVVAPLPDDDGTVSYTFSATTPMDFELPAADGSLAILNVAYRLIDSDGKPLPADTKVAIEIFDTATGERIGRHPHIRSYDYAKLTDFILSRPAKRIRLTVVGDPTVQVRLQGPDRAGTMPPQVLWAE